MKYEITKEFEALIGESRLESLNAHPGTVYGVDSEFNISYLNPAWFEFADENGGDIFKGTSWSLGSKLFDVIPAVQQPFYKDLFESALIDGKSLVVPRQSEYECSSEQVVRRFSMHIYPVDGGGLVIVNSLLVGELHGSLQMKQQASIDEKDYIDNDRFLYQCANCRRVRNLKIAGRWDWIPRFIKEPYPRTSHGICEPCMQHYYLGEE